MATEQKVVPQEAVEEIKALFGHLEKKQAASIEALKIVQKYNRWVSDEALKEVAELLDMTYHELDAVATFYSMIFRSPVGRHVILVCNSASCWILGSDDIFDHFKKKLNIDLGGTTPDDRFTLLPISCLGTCDHGPAMLIDEDLYQDIELDKLDEILEKYK